MSTLATSFNQGNTNTLPDGFRKVKLGSVLLALATFMFAAAPAAAPGEHAATLEVVRLPNEAKAAAVTSVYARGAAAPGPLTAAAYPPAAGQYSIAPSGDIVVLAADLITSVDVCYQPHKLEVYEYTGPVVANSMALSSFLSTRGVILLMLANATVAGSGGLKAIEAPGSAPAAGGAALSASKGTVEFNAADAVTEATVTLGIVPDTDLQALLLAETNLLLSEADMENQPEANSQSQQPSPAASPPAASNTNPTTPPPGAGVADSEAKRVVKLSKNEFAQKVNQATSAQLKKIFGTDDPKQIINMKREYDAIKQKTEEERRAAMTAQEKLADDYRRSEADKEKYKSLLDRERMGRAAERQENEIKRIFNGKVDDRYQRHVMRDMAQEFLKKKTPKQLSMTTNADIEKWLTEYLRKHPAFRASRSAGPARSGTPSGGRTPPKVAAQGKTLKLGQPNSMTDKEYQEYKKKNNLDF